jgi:hypothetical protein
MHLDLKTGKWQTNMLPPEMLDAQGRREVGRELRRENSMPPFQHGPYSASQPQINVSPPPPGGRPAAHSFSNLATPHGFAELDAETPGRYRPPVNDEKATYDPQRDGHGRDHRGRRGHSSSSRRYSSDDDMRSPPPAYRE